MKRRLTEAIQDFCTRVYEETSAAPTTLVLAPVSFDTLCADLAPTMRYDDGMSGDWPASPTISMETGYGGYLVIRRGRA